MLSYKRFVNPTKHLLNVELCQQYALLYDPMGFVCPVVLETKNIL